MLFNHKLINHAMDCLCWLYRYQTDLVGAPFRSDAHLIQLKGKYKYRASIDSSFCNVITERVTLLKYKLSLSYIYSTASFQNVNIRIKLTWLRINVCHLKSEKTNMRMVLCWNQQWLEKNGEQNNAFPPLRYPITYRICRHLGMNAHYECTLGVTAVFLWANGKVKRERSKESWHKLTADHMAWHTQMASKKVSVSSTSLSMTLPISCQICLGKVSSLFSVEIHSLLNHTCSDL